VISAPAGNRAHRGLQEIQEDLKMADDEGSTTSRKR
jgi:hypothetical protein